MVALVRGAQQAVLLLVIGWLFALGGAGLMVLYAFPELQLTNDSPR